MIITNQLFIYFIHLFTDHTNHAVFQKLYSNIPTGIVANIPPPCCIPLEFESLTLLITTDGMKEFQNTNLKGHQVQSGPSVELKTFEEMTVTKCGCR